MRALISVAIVALVLVAIVRVTSARAPMGRYSQPTPGVVYDTKTKLTWQQDAGAQFVWGSVGTPGTAQSYCAALPLAGGGWRLPTVSELQTLVDYSIYDRFPDGGTGTMIDPTFFPNTPADIYWSSTPFAQASEFAWGVNFSFGNANGYNMPRTEYVRCVR